MTLTHTRSRYGAAMTTGTRALTYAHVRQGADLELMWCNETGQAGVDEYRASGWQVVRPADVEQLEYGQDVPRDKDIGVFIEVDKKADRVRSPLTDSKGMRQVLMFMTGARRRQIREEEKRQMDRNAKKMAATEDLTLGNGEASISTEISQQVETYKVGTEG